MLYFHCGLQRFRYVINSHILLKLVAESTHRIKTAIQIRAIMEVSNLKNLSIDEVYTYGYKIVKKL